MKINFEFPFNIPNIKPAFGVVFRMEAYGGMCGFLIYVAFCANDYAAFFFFGEKWLGVRIENCVFIA